MAEGIADTLAAVHVPCFGPTASAARIESSKVFAKDFMTKHGIPTARWASFGDAESACAHVDSADYAALVVKASGLAAGKGVVVAENREDAKAAIRSMIQVCRITTERVACFHGCTMIQTGYWMHDTITLRSTLQELGLCS